jgi:hypothetical protein
MDNLANALEPFNENGEWFAEGSRWDWWVIGGRWEGMLINSELEACDYARKSEIAWELMAKAELECMFKFYNQNKQSEFASKSSEYPQPDESDTDYARRMFRPFSTHSFLTLNGDWEENGRMGWWGQVLEEEKYSDSICKPVDWPSRYQQLVRDVKDDEWLVIVDCHV